MTDRFWIVAVLLVSIFQPMVMAGTLAYEGFNYPAATTLSGANGGTGWSNAWIDVSANLGSRVAAGSLTADLAAPLGFDARSAGNAALADINSRIGRWLDCSSNGPFALAGLIDSNGNIGANSKTVYVSFLQQPSSILKFYEFEFHRSDLGDNGRLAGIGNDTADGNLYFRSRALPGGNFTLWNAGPGTTNVNFFVVRIDYKPGSDDVYVYRNPVADTEAANEPVLNLLAVADMAFNGLSLAAYVNNQTVKHDEIRVGSSWSSVLGDPPVFVVHPTDRDCYAGEPASLTSLAQSSLSLSYQWYRVTAEATNELTGKTSATLEFDSVQPGDAGQYFVTASNRLGIAVSAPVKLDVQPVSLTLSSPANIEVDSNSILNLNALVEGVAPVTLQWFKDGKPLDGATHSTVSETQPDAFDAGQYHLVASNAYGSVTSSVVTVALASAGALLAYEGFTYASLAGDIGNSAGGFGWGGSWQHLGGNASQLLPTNLAPGISAPPGFDAASSGGSLLVHTGSRKGRYLSTSPKGTFAQHGYLTASGLIGADGKTLYLSFLQQPNGQSLFYELELHRNDLGDGGRMAGVGNDSAGTNANFRLQIPPGGPSTFWSLGPGTTNVNLYVVRIDYKGGNDDVFVYRNPASLIEPSIPTLVLSNVADMSFDGISLAAYLNGRVVSHDEIRLGRTWADVMGQARSPELRVARHANHSTRLTLAGAANYSYGLEAANDLQGPWNGIGSLSASPLGAGEFTEESAADQRFYRASNSLAWSPPPSGDVVLAHFEGGTYGAWIPTGTAFGTGPAAGTLGTQQPVSGYQGSGLVNSYLGGDTSTGTLTSPPFVVAKPFINFLVGGGALPGQACLNLVISNVVVRTATGGNSELLTPQQWDVNQFLGHTAIVQIVDSATGSWGHINVDHITLSDIPFPSLSRTMLLTERLLNLPVKNGAAVRRVTVAVEGKAVRDFDIELADGSPDWWAYADVAAFSNKVATVSVSSLPAGSQGLKSISQTNGITGATNLYREPLRSQLHFSSKRGWLNDANAMFYHNGQYHLYYQHNPYGWSWGNMHWGHAVSRDMVNWKQMPEGIYPHSYGDMVYSGSAVVDKANTSGFKSGTNDVIVAAYTSTGRGECVAFSNDGGETFTEYPGNPVVVHNGRDPRLLWYAPSNLWVMALYNSTGGDGISFYTSSNLKNWTYRSKINGYFECPDLFELPVDDNISQRMWLLCDASGSYQLGQFNGVSFTPETARLQAHDGAAFYASQTFSSMAPGDGRLVRIAWAQISTPGMPFNQLMYFPTELKLKTTSNGVRLCSTPIHEITNNVATTYSWTNLTLVAGNNPLSGIRGTLLHVKAEFSPGSAQSLTFAFQGVTAVYNAGTQEIICNGRKSSHQLVAGKVQLEMIVDRNTIEIFGNDGQIYMPLPASNPPGNALISLTCAGGNATFSSLTVHKLKSIWTGSSN